MVTLMVKRLLLVVFFGVVASAVRADEPGFRPLFNGKDLTGWEGDLSLWKVADEVIVGDSAGIKHNQFLCTKEEFGNFELKLEFRLKDGVGNSGVQFRTRRIPESTEVSGYQADLGENYWGCLYDESRRNKVLVQAPADLAKSLKKGDWNEYTIRAERDHIVLKINDVTTVDYLEPDPTIARKGIIALQVHSGGPLKIEFRKLRGREIFDRWGVIFERNAEDKFERWHLVLNSGSMNVVRQSGFLLTRGRLAGICVLFSADGPRFSPQDHQRLTSECQRADKVVSQGIPEQDGFHFHQPPDIELL